MIGLKPDLVAYLPKLRQQYQGPALHNDNHSVDVSITFKWGFKKTLRYRMLARHVGSKREVRGCCRCLLYLDPGSPKSEHVGRDNTVGR